MTVKTLNKQELVEALGISLTSLNNYVLAGLPVYFRGKQGKPSQYVLEDCRKWMEERNGPPDDDMSAAKLRKLTAEASLAELELERERGQLVEIEAAAKIVADEYSKVRAKLLALPTALSGLVEQCTNQREVTDVLDKYVREILVELSADDPTNKKKNSVTNTRSTKEIIANSI